MDMSADEAGTSKHGYNVSVVSGEVAFSREAFKVAFSKHFVGKHAVAIFFGISG